MVDKQLDNFSDLELSDDEDELHKQFMAGAEHLKTFAAKLDSKTLLELYAHYKQGLEGRCNIPRPGFFDAKGKQKWDSWNSLGDLSKDLAKEKYISLIQKLDPQFGCGPSDSKSKDQSWVSVSTFAKDENIINPNTHMTIIDHVQEGNIKEIEYLLKEDPKIVDFRDDNGLSAIHWAADRGYTDILKTLLSVGSKVDSTDYTGQTPLHYAVSCGHVECVKLLLEVGAPIAAVDESGDTPLDLAIDVEVKKLLESV